MNAVILTEEAQTVAETDDDPQLLEYYKGQFRPVATLVDELSDVVETDVYILSDEHGLCKGRSTLSEIKRSSMSSVRQEVRKSLTDAVPDTDVIIMLLTRGAFINVIEPIWDKLVEITKPGAIWALGLPESALDGVDIDPLRRKNDLYVYRRSGVARLGIETRNQLLAAVQCGQE